jgi:hypothetical protein
MESRWSLRHHWTVFDPGTKYASVIVSGEDEYSEEHFTVAVFYDLTETGVALRGVSVLPPDHHLRTLLPHKPAESLSSDLLRRLPIDPIRASILEKLQADPSLLTPVSLVGKLVKEGHGTATDDELAYFEAAQRAAQAAVAASTDPLKGARPKRGRGAVNDDWYATLSVLYLGSHAKHGQRCVIELANQLGTTPQRVSDWVRRARKLGWLSEAPAPGQAGGSSGLRLQQWLEEGQWLKEEEKER